jgi:probable HAF family extracellular repeat protein
MVGLGDISGGGFNSQAYGVSADGSVVVGQGASASGTEAFRWTSGGGMVGLGDLAGGAFDSLALAVSDDGSVAIGQGASASGVEAFRWTSGGGMVGLGDLLGGGFFSQALAVSADGSVIVGTGTSASGSEAFIWDSTNGMQSLLTVLENDYGLDLTGWTLAEARGISDDGFSIVGYGTNPSGFTEGWIATIPEPSTVSLLGFGLAGIAVIRRRS